MSPVNPMGTRCGWCEREGAYSDPEFYGVVTIMERTEPLVFEFFEWANWLLENGGGSNITSHNCACVDCLEEARDEAQRWLDEKKCSAS
jgi:hypothetical protein